MKKKSRKRSLRHALRNSIAKDLRTPKYRLRVKPNKRKKQILNDYQNTRGRITED